MAPSIDAADVRVTRKRTADAEEQAAGLSAWNQRYEQISAGRFEGVVEEVRLDGMQVFREEANRGLYQHGSPRPRTVTVGTVATAGRHAWFCGQALQAMGSLVMSGDAEFELVTGAGLELAAVCVDVERLVAAATCLHGPGSEEVLPLHAAIAGSTQQPALARLLGSTLQLARDRPALLEAGEARRLLETALTEAVVDCVVRPCSLQPLPATAASRRRIVADAREYMRAHADQVISVVDLCSAIGVSRRSLQYAFEDVLHLSPVTYLRVMRLNRVREDLKTPRHEGVGDIAARWGFWHLSRFAADYRTLFGELPSTTRTRSMGATRHAARDGRETRSVSPRLAISG